MSALRPPGLGPIIGHTTHDSCRLWIQAGDPEDANGTLNSNRRTMGVIGLLSPDRKSVVQGWYFRLQREFDRTGTFVLGKDVALGHHENDSPNAHDLAVPLEPDTEYTVRLGTLSLDDPMPDAETIGDAVLARRLPDILAMAPLLLDLRVEECEIAFRTFPAPATIQDKMAFLLGSCRYPGLLWKIKEADRIFGPMRTHLEQTDTRTAARFTLMVGDQIYADKFNRFVPIGRADTYQEFQERYQTAFGSPNMRALLRTAPSYMLLDDHEIEDNWTQNRLHGSENKHRLFNYAVGAYMSYQWSHGPRTFGRMLYYQFACGGYPFFALDTRTQRISDDSSGLTDNHLMGRPSIDPMHKGQVALLLEWLSEQQRIGGNVPKFIPCGSVFVPNAMDERLTRLEPGQTDPLYEPNADRRDASDSWAAYPKTRKAIVEHIVAQKIQNVVFLTGDIHCSNIARMTFETMGGTDTGLIAYDITSSAFYWPFPFADGDPNNYVHDSKLDDQFDHFPYTGGVMHYTSWAYTQEDNFCRIDMDKATGSMTVGYYDRDGKQVVVSSPSGNPVAENKVAMAPW
jgi:alkaline phosphatase D